MLSEHHNLAAAKRFFRSAKAVTGVIPDRVTTDGHDAYPRAIRLEFGSCALHRTNSYLNNRLEQDHPGIKGRCGRLTLRLFPFQGQMLTRESRVAAASRALSRQWRSALLVSVCFHPRYQRALLRKWKM